MKIKELEQSNYQFIVDYMNVINYEKYL